MNDCYCAHYIDDPDQFCNQEPCINEERALDDYWDNQILGQLEGDIL